MRSWTTRNLMLTLAATLACSAGAKTEPEDPAADRPAGATLENDGIRLADDSRQYVVIETVAAGGSEVTIRAPARVTFRDNAVSRVGAPIGARVMKLHVQVGDDVGIGQALATLASPDASGYHAELSRAKVELTAASEALRRQDEMLAKGVGREYEKVVAQMRVKDAQERVRAAKRDVGLLGKSFGGTVIVTSQIEGTVLRRGASIGAQVDPSGEPLFEIGDPSNVWIVADVFQDDLDLIKPGGHVKVDIATHPEPLSGEIEAVGVLLDTAVRRAPVYIGVKATEAARLKAGMFARAWIEADARDTLTVPTGAVLIKDGDRTIVYVEREDGAFVQREVQLGHSFEDRVEVVSGLAPGDKVAAKGALLIDGAANQLL